MELNFLESDLQNTQKILNKKMQKITAIAAACSILLAGMFFLFKDEISIDSFEFMAWITLSPFLVMSYFAYQYSTEAKLNFWFDFALKNNATYSPFLSLDGEQSIMLQQGFNRKAEHGIVFLDEQSSLNRIFNYSFSKKEGGEKHPKHYFYTVFAFKHNGKVPHIYLNYLYDRYRLNLGKNLPLPTEFEKNFSISVPDQYEIEALEIFTIDLLAYILDSEIRTDVEIVDGEVLFFIEEGFSFPRNHAKGMQMLKEKYIKANDLFKFLKSKLDKTNVAQIGSNTTSL